MTEHKQRVKAHPSQAKKKGQNEHSKGEESKMKQSEFQTILSYNHISRIKASHRISDLNGKRKRGKSFNHENRSDEDHS